MKIEKVKRKSPIYESVILTENNMREVLKWCGVVNINTSFTGYKSEPISTIDDLKLIESIVYGNLKLKCYSGTVDKEGYDCYWNRRVDFGDRIIKFSKYSWDVDNDLTKIYEPLTTQSN